MPYEENQCDGCRAGMPLVHGIHRTKDDKPYMCCTKRLYNYKPYTYRKNVESFWVTTYSILFEGDEVQRYMLPLATIKYIVSGLNGAYLMGATSNRNIR